MQDMNHDMHRNQKTEEVTVMRDLLSAVDIVASNRYVTIDSQDELNVYVRYITYRVQQDFYDLGRECGEFSDMSWDDFVLFMRQCKPARTAAAIVVRETLKDFYQCGHYNFDVKEVTLNVADEQDEMLHFSSLFSPTEGIGLVESLLLFAELAQYRHQLDQGSKCSWPEFLAQLEKKGPLWNQVSMAFHDALARLDFKPFWQSEKLAEQLTQMETQGA